MIEKIGTNAGLVWNTLNNGPLELKTLKKAIKITDKDLFAALGWLAREGKISFTENDKDLFVSLV